MNFWQTLAKPIIGLAPMDGVSDCSYREIQARHGHPDVVYTEFIPVEGIVRLSPQLLRDFWYSSQQRPVLAQIYGNDPALFYAATQLICELGFDGVDINMGCPAKSVVHRGCGAALIRTPELAKSLIKASQQAVLDWCESGVNWAKWPVLSPEKAHRLLREFIRHSAEFGINYQIPQASERRQIPVSVKTRVGFDKPVTEAWLTEILSTKPATIALHGRTLKQLYTGKADWNEIAKGVALRDKLQSHLPVAERSLILGNGDVNSLNDAVAKISMSHVDGVLVGRATFGNPWLMADLVAQRKSLKEPALPGIQLSSQSRPQEITQIFAVIIEHAKLHQQQRPDNFVQMRKNLAWYISAIAGAAELRSQLVRASSVEEVTQICEQYLKSNMLESAY